MNNLDILSRIQMETHWKYSESIDLCPWIRFPEAWEVQIIPPFSGAMMRFRVRLFGCEKSVSVYADFHDLLGYYGSPYWEVYPAISDDVFRCHISDVISLVNEINKILLVNDTQGEVKSEHKS